MASVGNSKQPAPAPILWHKLPVLVEHPRRDCSLLLFTSSSGVLKSLVQHHRILRLPQLQQFNLLQTRCCHAPFRPCFTMENAGWLPLSTPIITKKTLPKRTKCMSQGACWSTSCALLASRTAGHNRLSSVTARAQSSASSCPSSKPIHPPDQSFHARCVSRCG
jgi:hypothetical protein